MADPGSAYAKWLVFEAVAAASKTHLFLHASSAIVGEGAVLVVGETGRGKSTLARALVAAGAEPHNDDVTPLSLASDHAERFPKDEPDAAGWQARSFPVRALLFLGPQEAQPTLRLAVDRLPEGLTAIEGVTVEDRGGHHEVVGRRRPGALDALRELCESAGVTVLQDLSAPEPVFAAVPVVRRCAPHEAVGRLVANVFGRAGRSMDELAWEVLGAVRDAELWELTPGEPAATAEAVLAALEHHGHAS
jgi:energy-coupling factor transporter ATP-binding protein EcfA2